MRNAHRLFVLCLIATLPACAPWLPRYAAAGGVAETGFYENIETPKLALLEYRLGKYFAWKDRPYEVVCAAAESVDPRRNGAASVPLEAEVERRLIARFPGLSPLSRCEKRGADILARDTGVAAAIFDVNEFTCEAPDNCLGWGGYYANGTHGWSYYRLRFVRGEWRISKEDLGIVVT